mmetsp:Transcript_14423/g.47031  ORF Transcript_14423/g.47031 Transcript_14423/m.47031 type:complete len:103 (+) Transcript_14423:1023-1331(+)
MWVQTLFKKSCEWHTIKSIFGHLDRYSSSQTTASMSRWFVGSSRSKRSGWIKSALANATRMRHPPEKELVGDCFFFSEKPRPVRISEARVVAVAASSASSRS